MNRGNFRVSLLRVSDQLSHADLDNLKFLCQTVVTPARMEKICSPLDLFNALEERGLLLNSNVNFLYCILSSAKCRIPIDQLDRDGYVRSDKLPSIKEYFFYECLLGLALNLRSDEFEQVKFRFKPNLQMSLDKVFSATELFRLLIQRRIITPVNMRILYDTMLNIARHDLSESINQYLIKSGQQAYQTEPPQVCHACPTDQRQAHHPQAYSQDIGRQDYQLQQDVFQRPQTQPCTPTQVPLVQPVEATPDEHGDRQLKPTLSGQFSYSESNNGSLTPRLGSVSSFESGGSSLSSSSLSTKPSMGQLTNSSLDGKREPPMDENSARVYVAGNNIINHGGVRSSVAIGEPLQPGANLVSHEGLILDPLDQVEEQVSLQAQEFMHKQRELFVRDEQIRKFQEEIVQLQGQIDSGNIKQIDSEGHYRDRILEYEKSLDKITREAEWHRKQTEQIQEVLRNSSSSHNNGDYYKMNKSPHGICLIINNHTFYHNRYPDKAHPTRGGAQVDQFNLKKTFQYLQYKVEVHENLSSQDMNEVMLDMARRDHSQYDSFLCCILTHGEHEVVHGADSTPVNLNDLTGVMKMSTTLQGKPKLFIIQACRGDAEGEAVKLDDDIQQDAGGNPYSNTIPKEADFFFGFATPTGNAAYRSRRFGSWFISEVCQVFINNAHTLNLNAMMKKVNNRVAQAYTKDGHKQAPEFVDRLRFQVQFFRFIPRAGSYPVQ